MKVITENRKIIQQVEWGATLCRQMLDTDSMRKRISITITSQIRTASSGIFQGGDMDSDLE